MKKVFLFILCLIVFCMPVYAEETTVDNTTVETSVEEITVEVTTVEETTTETSIDNPDKIEDEATVDNFIEKISTSTLWINVVAIAGSALAVDRDKFSEIVTSELKKLKNVKILSKKIIFSLNTPTPLFIILLSKTLILKK